MQPIHENAYIQGSAEWLALRKTKITATDAAVIMGVNPWKNIQQLYIEKTTDAPPNKVSARMQRGLDLEPIARDLYTLKTGIKVEPKVIVSEWAMASLDGISECGSYVVEIKCPGDSDHAEALQGKVPTKYYPQLQHQMWLTNVSQMDYCSFDGLDLVIVPVNKDEDYISKMISKEYEFYLSLQDLTPPEEYIIRTDEQCKIAVENWREAKGHLEFWTEEEKQFRKEMIAISPSQNWKGFGVKVQKIMRVGLVQYCDIPLLQGVDLDQYRKPASESWRITLDGDNGRNR